MAGVRTNALETDFSEILPEEVEEAVKKAAEISMGTEIADTDIDNIRHLCEQVRSRRGGVRAVRRCCMPVWRGVLF